MLFILQNMNQFLSGFQLNYLKTKILTYFDNFYQTPQNKFSKKYYYMQLPRNVT